MNLPHRVFRFSRFLAFLLGIVLTGSGAHAETNRAEARGKEQQEKVRPAGRSAGSGSKWKIKGRRCISPWLIYRGEQSIEQLRPHADIIASVSLCGGGSRKFVEQCHALDIEVYLLVGGNERTFDTSEHRQETIDGYLRKCREIGYDGIDLDHEGIDGSFRKNHVLFLQEASKRLHEEGKTLAICVSYLMSTSKTTLETHMPDFYDPGTIGRTCDMVRVMCYDMVSMSGQGVGPISTQPWARDAMQYWLQYVSREKLIMGLPAYSGDFEMVSGGKRERIYADKPTLPDGTKSESVWLPYEQIHMHRYLDQAGHTHLFFASDHVSTRAHLETVEKLDLPGIAFWNYEAVTPETWKVVRDWHQRGLGNGRGSWWLVSP